MKRKLILVPKKELLEELFRITESTPEEFYLWVKSAVNMRLQGEKFPCNIIPYKGKWSFYFTLESVYIVENDRIHVPKSFPIFTILDHMMNKEYRNSVYSWYRGTFSKVWRKRHVQTNS